MGKEEAVINLVKEWSQDKAFYDVRKKHKLQIRTLDVVAGTIEAYSNGVICMVNQFKGKRLNGLEKSLRFGLSKKLYFMVAKELENGNL